MKYELLCGVWGGSSLGDNRILSPFKFGSRWEIQRSSDYHLCCWQNCIHGYGSYVHQVDFRSYACKDWANGTDTDPACVKEHLWTASYLLNTENKDGEDPLAMPLEGITSFWSRSLYHREARAGVQSLACLPERWPVRGLTSRVLDSYQSLPSDNGSPQLLGKNNERHREKAKKSWLILQEGRNYYLVGQDRIMGDGESGFLDRKCLSWGREALKEDRILSLSIWRTVMGKRAEQV